MNGLAWAVGSVCAGALYFGIACYCLGYWEGRRRGIGDAQRIASWRPERALALAVDPSRSIPDDALTSSRASHREDR